MTKQQAIEKAIEVMEREADYGIMADESEKCLTYSDFPLVAKQIIEELGIGDDK